MALMRQYEDLWKEEFKTPVAFSRPDVDCGPASITLHMDVDPEPLNTEQQLLVQQHSASAQDEIWELDLDCGPYSPNIHHPMDVDIKPSDIDTESTQMAQHRHLTPQDEGTRCDIDWANSSSPALSGATGGSTPASHLSHDTIATLPTAHMNITRSCNSAPTSASPLKVDPFANSTSSLAPTQQEDLEPVLNNVGFTDAPHLELGLGTSGSPTCSGLSSSPASDVPVDEDLELPNPEMQQINQGQLKHWDECEICDGNFSKPPAKAKMPQQPHGDYSSNVECETKLTWVTCMGCQVASHWLCLSVPQREAVKLSKFTCSECRRGGICIGCLQAVNVPPTLNSGGSGGLLFRCLTCRRPAHYAHLPAYPLTRFPDIIFQNHCPDCSACGYKPDKILAWRPYPSVFPLMTDEPMDDCRHSAKEFLVKWAERSYRHLQWVPERWFSNTDDAYEMLRDFVQDSPCSKPEAEEVIPSAWNTVEQVLDLVLWQRRDEANDAAFTKQRTLTMVQGERPDIKFLLSLEDWETLEGRKFSVGDIADVAWIRVKWQGLDDKDVTWDSPPSPDGDDNYYVAYIKALRRKGKGRNRTSTQATKKNRSRIVQPDKERANLADRIRNPYTEPSTTGPTGRFPLIPPPKNPRNRDSV
ncbi:hypothetical protein B0H12DRAFT_1229009 [Mycena haematopus]|nr:hypothetical protein B0H12DRAFT_1229009 [Mycena haematopus]